MTQLKDKVVFTWTILLYRSAIDEHSMLKIFIDRTINFLWLAATHRLLSPILSIKTFDTTRNGYAQWTWLINVYTLHKLSTCISTGIWLFLDITHLSPITLVSLAFISKRLSLNCRRSFLLLVNRKTFGWEYGLVKLILLLLPLPPPEIYQRKLKSNKHCSF